MKLTPELNAKLDELAGQYSLSRAAVDALAAAVAAGHGKMAQFNHPDLGGSGQWMAGGMTMVGDMFNHDLRGRVAAVCQALAGLHLPTDVTTTTWQSFSSATAWWPDELGTPAQTGGQNASRYAIFPQVRRLAILENGQCIIYDTLDYTVTGVSQQQSSTASMTLGTNRGPIAITSLPVVSSKETGPEKPAAPRSHSHSFSSSSTSVEVPQSTSTPSSPAPANSQDSEGILGTIERMAELRDKNVLTEEEFLAKKAELLSKL